MNNDRRNTIAALIKELSEVEDNACELRAKVEDLRDRIEIVRDEEQDYFDNTPESLQGGVKGAKAEEAIGALDEAISAVEDAGLSLDEVADYASTAATSLGEASQ